MPTTIKIHKQGMQEGAKDFNNTVRQLVRTVSRLHVADITKITNNSGGSGTAIAQVADFVNVAASGSNLADKTTTEAAYTTVLDAIRELYTQANLVNTTLGINTVTYSGGGASVDGTIAAITVSVTGAATGVQATAMNTTKNALNNAIYQLTGLVNKAATSVGETKLAMDYALDTAATIAAITIAGGTAATPGVTKVAVDASLVTLRSSIFALATKLNAITNATAPRVIAV